jgi:cell filamentation protein
VANYTYPETDTVKNKLGATRHDELERLESRLVAARIYELTLGHGPKGRFDAAHLKAIHRHLFQDVYEWAGRTRNERVRLSDGTIATEPVIRKAGGAAFLAARLIAAALDDVAARLLAAGYLVGLPRAEFAVRAADVLAQLNAIHPFREGNGRTQRAFVSALARRAGYDLDFTVVSKERMIQASIAANEQSNPTMMRRLFDEISDPARTAALREAIAFFEAQQFPWNACYYY